MRTPCAPTCHSASHQPDEADRTAPQLSALAAVPWSYGFELVMMLPTLAEPDVANRGIALSTDDV